MSPVGTNVSLIGTDVSKNVIKSTVYSPLMTAASHGHSCVKLLIDTGADVNQEDRRDVTALMLASQEGHHKCVELLIESRTDVNKRDCLGATPY